MNGGGERFTQGWGAAILLAALVGYVLLAIPPGASTDLRALWLAALAFGAGDLGNVYPPGTVFTMSPPPAWAAAHPGETLYPYLYPPIWAALGAKITPYVTFETVAAAMRVANAAMLTGCAALAWRITGARLSFPIHVGLATFALVQTFPGSLAIMENQPQIAVSFLILLALDRLKAGAPHAAGCALAVAAALKVYPLLLALLWLATGERRAVLSFVLAGAGLAALSILLAGWPLHASYLATLSAISETVLLTPVSYALVPALAQVFAKDTFIYHQAAQGGWLVMTLPPLASVLAKAILFTALAVLALAMRRSDDFRRWAYLWPAALLTISLLGPLSWAYHYIPALAAAPVLLYRLGARAGAGVLLVCLLPLSPLIAGAALDAGVPGEQLQIAGTAALSSLALLLFLLGTSPLLARPA